MHNVTIEALVLWFDVEEGYNTTAACMRATWRALWFDVEEGYNTTKSARDSTILWLWFDVEERYNTTQKSFYLCTRLTAIR